MSSLTTLKNPRMFDVHCNSSVGVFKDPVSHKALTAPSLRGFLFLGLGVYGDPFGLPWDLFPCVHFSRSLNSVDCPAARTQRLLVGLQTQGAYP